MEDIYTIKIKSKPDTRNLYPSERRYSASTVSGLAWVHIALAATSCLLACLSLANPLYEGESNNFYNVTEDINDVMRNSWILVVGPSLLSIFALAAGIASILASVRWYIDRYITWLFVTAILSSIFSFLAFIMVCLWFISTSETDYTMDFDKDKTFFKDFLIVKESDILENNGTHLFISRNSTNLDDSKKSYITMKQVLSVNILIASFLEFLWSILSINISYKGMRNDYNDTEREGNCIAVITTIKGNTKNLPRNSKIVPPKSDLINHCKNGKIKRFFLAHGDNGFYIKNQNDKCEKQNTETSSEFYKERMMNYLNKCASLDNISNPEVTPSIQSENLNPIQENVELNFVQENINRITPVSWGDSNDYTIYNQNNINFDNIFKYPQKKSDEVLNETIISPH